jgi:DnaJ family protein C protein 8
MEETVLIDCLFLRINMEEKRRRLKKEGKPYAVEEDDPIKFKIAVNILTMKLFADLERK